MSLTFDQLRDANIERLPLFKNKHGQPAHSNQDGSDWSPAQWFQATVGELGEFATVRLEYEAGKLTHEEYKIKAGKELADVATYLSILSIRCLDELLEYEHDGKVMQGYPFENSPAQMLMSAMSHLGEYANARKKLDRGDFTQHEFETIKNEKITATKQEIDWMLMPDLKTPHPGDHVVVASFGVNLGYEIVDKFNEVSKRVGCEVFL